ncbi:MAG: TonB-dependent receptor [Bacteroidetes bacterium]|nr:TonB-dependent receptor [Bacteroidota bacterium]
MKNQFSKLFLLLAFFLICTFALNAQSVLKGRVVDDVNDEPLIGVNIQIKNTSIGTSTDLDGNFSLNFDGTPTVLVFSYTGYQPLEHALTSTDFLEVRMLEGIELDDVVVVGSRFAPRTVITSPVPIDNVKIGDLITTGQNSFDKMLHYTIPSFNSTQQTISDATAHFDPADLRGVGPSRTLVLVNGKRKNASSLVYINDTPGKGEVGVDMKSIPSAAIERIEILRDGASAQYGSDAIAGVINIILKDEYKYTDVNIHSGITTEGDGFSMGYDLNTGFKIGKNGFLNLTTSFSDQKETNRAPSPGGDGLFGVIFGDDAILNGTHPWLVQNPDMGMHVGTPNMTQADVFYNLELPLGSNAEFYGFGGLTYRKGLSYALYRTPYWVSDDHNIFHEPGETYEGFQPTFETNIFDNTLAFGVRGEKSGWMFDLSHISGSNTVDYTVGNSQNLDLGAQSPTTFNTGGYEFRNNVSNLDISRQFGIATVSVGSEFRTENFVAIAGEEASYIGNGAQSFPGIQPQNEVDKDRYNVGVYADIVLDVTKDFLIGGAARFEEYSDFGDNFSWKVNARYKMMDDRLSIRASASTGFRAPSLHQRYLSNVQTLVSGGTISNQGTFNNESPVIRQLEVDPLKDETASNISIGAAFKPATGLYISVDYYKVDVDDRIVYSSSIASSDSTTAVYQILNDANITSLKFFTNAVNTSTSGVDIVANYSTDLGSAKLGINAAANFNKTDIEGKINTPKPISAAGVDVFDRKEQSRILSARPNQKVMLGLSYTKGDFKAVLNNTYFGEVTWQHATDANNDQTFGSKFVTDLYFDYRVSKNLGLSLAVNNLFNVYPDKIDPKGDFTTDLGGRFQYPWEVNQFGFQGTIISGKLNIRF